MIQRTTLALLMVLTVVTVVLAGGWSKPRNKGELGLIGDVISVDAKGRSLVILARQFTNQAGNTGIIPRGKRKVIYTTKTTKFSKLDYQTRKSLPRTFRDLRKGLRVNVEGKDKGSGKPMTASYVDIIW